MTTLHVFDFDDTLVDSSAQIHITKADGTKFSLSSEDYAEYQEEEGDEFDFSEFESYGPLKNAEVIEPIFAELRAAIALDGPSSVIILTARGNPRPVKLFLAANKVRGVEVITTGSSDPMAKAKYILDRVLKEDIDEVRVFEDNVRNIRSIKKVITPTGIKLRTRRVNKNRI